MADKLVTLGTYHNVIEAQFAVNRLKAAGIPAFVADDNIVGMDFLLGNAIGWIKVQVRGPDLERAEAVLADPADPVDEEEIPWDDADLSGAADAAEQAEIKESIAEQKAADPSPDAPADRGERLVTTAYRLAVFGIIFAPLNVISLAYVLVVAFGVGDLSAAATRRYYLALLIDLGVLSFWGFLVCAGFGTRVFFL